MSTILFHKICFRLREKLDSLALCPIRKTVWRWQGMSVGAGVTLGRMRVTWPHQVIIGADCLLEADVIFKFDGIYAPGPSIVIDEGVFLGNSVEFNIRQSIHVGPRCAIASGCRFIDHDHGISGSRIDETPGIEAAIALGADVWLGCNVIVLKGVQIGNSAVVGAGSVVTRNIPEGEIWAGIPARRLSSRGGGQGGKNSEHQKTPS